MSEKYQSQDLLYLLCWHDALERLDTLLLEARHLQVSIIYFLREPGLHVPLRFEEHHLWGQGWGTALSRIDSPGGEAHLVDCWMASYPTPSEVVGGPPPPDHPPAYRGFNVDAINRVEKELSKLVYAVWFGSGWGRDQRRHYHSLRALQALKKLIYRDKLVLSRRALDWGVGCAWGDWQNQARFMVLRAGVLARAQEYILRLHDHQSAFSKAVDTGEQNHPRPSIERRREQGIYMDFLSDRTRDLQRDMHILMDELRLDEFRRSEVIFHRWRYDFTSHTGFLDNEIQEAMAPDERRPSLPTSIRYVNTSYYMPERPDLQPVIAHEVAHGVVRDRLDDLSTYAMQSGLDGFTDLLARLRTTMFEFKDYPGMPVQEFEVDGELKEIACDLMAVSIKGMSYVYALFLETIGFGLEGLLFDSTNKRIDLEMADTLGGASRLFLHHRQWYYRGRLVVAWMRRIHHWDLTRPPQGGGPGSKNLDSHLLDGVEAVLQRLNELLDSYLPASDKDAGHSWKVLTDRLCEVVNEAEVGNEIRDWRSKRSKDDRTESGAKGERRYPRSMARLNRNVRDMLYRVQLGMKCRQGKPLHCESHSDIGQVQKRFEEIYGVRHRVAGDGADETDDVLPLYRHLYDIPWQSALMRAMDLLVTPPKLETPPKDDNSYPSNEALMEVLHFDMGLGRELFELGLEYYFWDTETAHHRLSTVVYLIASLLQPAESIDISHSARKRLDNWLKPGANSTTDFEDLRRGEGDLCNRQYKALAERLSASYLVESAGIDLPEHRKRRVQRIAGFKLQQLNSLLADPEMREVTCLVPLRAYLSIRRDPGENGDMDKNNRNGAKREFYTTLRRTLTDDTPSTEYGGLSNDESRRKRLTDQWKKDGYEVPDPLRTILEPDSPHLPPSGANDVLDRNSDNTKQSAYPLRISTFIVSRLSLAGSYAHLREGDAKQALSLAAAFKGHPDECKYPYLPACAGKFYDKVLIGRYDILRLAKTHPMCRCPLPVFGEMKGLRQEGFVGELFPGYFSRRELALQARLNSKSTWPVVNAKIIGVLVIALQRRTFRLDFLYRLVQSITNKEDVGTEVLEGVGGLFQDRDYAFLTDGWGDLVLVFVGGKESIDKTRVVSIFDIQNAIYQDFMVDRTELLLTPEVLDCISRLPHVEDETNFHVTVQARLMEDRALRWSNSEFLAKIEKGKEELRNKSGIDTEFTVVKTPGRMDFGFHFLPPTDNMDNCPENFYDTLHSSFMDVPYLDRLDSSIGCERPKGR